MKYEIKLLPIMALFPLLAACPNLGANGGKNGDCIEAIELCDPQDRRRSRVILYNECEDTFTQHGTCDAGMVCDDSVPGQPDMVVAARCVPEEDCGDTEFARVCNPDEPNDVYFADECGNIGRRADDCMDASSRCIEPTPGQATCECEVLPETYCSYSTLPQRYYDESTIVRRDSCGNESVVETCEYGAHCIKDEKLAGGEASCQRSLDASQVNSPYYDFGCWAQTEFLTNKTKLEADCRCRVPSGADGVNFVETSTQMYPYGKLPNCQAIDKIKGRTFDPPLGSGPQFTAFGDSGQASWFGGWFDPVERDFYGLVSLNNPDYRAVGTIVAFDVDTGARRIVSGVYPDPRQGNMEFGSGYKTPNTLPNGPAERTLAASRAMRVGPDRQLYVLSIGNTGQAESREAEIIRVDPQSGLRTLVWQSKVEGREAQGYGQCLSNNWEGESLTIVPLSFAVDARGSFFMSFYSMAEGMGIIRVTSDGSECEVITRHNAGELDVGTGYTSQAGGRYRAMLVKDEAVYTTVEPWGEFLKVDIATGDRFAVSTTETNPGASPGESTIEYDATRNLFYTVGGSSRYEGAIIEESTGKRQRWYGDMPEAEALVKTAYEERRDINSHYKNALANGNYHGNGPFALDPDDPDIAWFIISGGGLVKVEWSTFNGIITSF